VSFFCTHWNSFNSFFVRDLYTNALRLLSIGTDSPELVYELELAALSEAESEGKVSKAQAHREEATAARSVLPHFNLEGLWVGK
jgi:hypothetical protein